MPIRIAICQKLLRRYRVPVYDLLGDQEGVDLTVFAQLDRSSVGAWAGDDHRFRLVESPTRRLRGVPGALQHQAAQVEAVRSGRFDLVILPWDVHFVSTLWPATGSRRAKRTSVALWGHGYSKRPGRLRDRARDAIGRRADAVLLYSNAMAGVLVNRGFSAARVFVAPNAIDQRPIQAARAAWIDDPARLEGFRADHGLDPQRTVLFISRLIRENRAELLVETLERLRGEDDRARLVIVGDGPAREDLQTIVKRRGLDDRVLFPGAIYEDMELAPWMLSSVCLSYPTNIGLTLLHAFGYGLPVVTSNAPGVHGPEIEALRDGHNGLLFEDGDPGSLLACWRRLMDDPALRATLGERARSEVLERVTLEAMVQGFLDLAAIVDGQKRSVAPMNGR